MTETTTPQRPTPEESGGVSRRAVIGGIAGGTVGAGALGVMFHEGFGPRYTQETPHGTGTDDDAYTAEDVIYTMCMQCNTYCTLKVRLADAGDTGATSLVRKIAGNPYSPLMQQPLPAIPYDTPLEDAVKGIGDMARDSKSRSGGVACLKGQAGIQTVHDAKRITRPLKRVGERGSGQWTTISWEQALEEIANGSDLGTPGFKDWWAYASEEEVMGDVAKVESGEITQEQFEQTWGEVLIDPKRPELGPRSNLLTILCGERQNLLGVRFGNNIFGTVNQYNHGGTCGMTGVQGNVHTHPTTNYQRMYADIDECRYLVVWGTEPLTAQKGPTWLAPRISVARRRGMKMVVVDPRMSKTAEKADRWVPVEPGKDMELALAIGRWIVENERYDEQYLRAPGKAAATEIGEPTWSDATYLIKLDDPKMGRLSMVDLGRAEPPQPDEEGNTPDPEPVVLVGGEPRGADTTTELADLEVDTTIDGHRVKSVFTLLKERLLEREIADLAGEAGVDEEVVAEIGSDFTAQGKKACIMSYRGPAMHTNGYDTIRAIGYLNFLIGNHDWKGGHIGAQKGFSPTEGRYDINKVPGGNKGWGTTIARQKAKYEDSSFFKEDGYPAKRRWYPFPGNMCHEVIPSAAVGYPYSIKALFMNRHSPLNSSPGASRIAKQLAMTDRIELVVSFDITLGDSSMYADYVLPDLTYLEKFTQESIYPSQQYAVTQLGQPTTRAFEGPRPVEDFYIELAKQLDLPGVGEGAFGPGTSLDSSSDYWLKMAANVAYAGQEPVPDASAEELELFSRTRRKALGDTFEEDRWKQAVTAEEWPKVVYVLNRGGRFSGQAAERADGYEGEWLKHRYEGLCQFYDPKTAALKDCMTGENYDGLAKIRPVMKSDGTIIGPTDDRPLHFVNWKSRHMGTHRTVNNAWLREIRPENYLWINASDAAERGIKNGDRVRVTSPTATVESTAMVLQGLRPGTVGAEAAFGHKGYAAGEVTIDGEPIAGVSAYGHTKAAQNVVPGSEEFGFGGARSAGFAVNELLEEDTVLGGGGLTDPIGGGAAQLDTWVQVEKI